MSDFLDALVTDLARYARVGRSLGEQSSYLRAMGDDVRLFALNAQIGASRLGDQGAALDAVARLLTEQSQATSPLVATVAERAASAVTRNRGHDLPAVAEHCPGRDDRCVRTRTGRRRGDPSDAARNMLGLADALQRGSDRTFAALNSVARQLSDVLEHVGHVGVGIDRLARLSLNGRVELASVPDAGSISTLFSDVERQVGDARQRLAEFATIEEVARDLERAAGHDAMHAAANLHDSAATLAAPSAAQLA